RLARPGRCFRKRGQGREVPGRSARQRGSVHARDAGSLTDALGAGKGVSQLLSSAADWMSARRASRLFRMVSPCLTTTHPAAVGSSPLYLRRKSRLPSVLSNSVSRWLAPDRDRFVLLAAADNVPLLAHRTTSLSDTSS